jgi:hypothetical protein
LKVIYLGAFNGGLPLYLSARHYFSGSTVILSVRTVFFFFDYVKSSIFAALKMKYKTVSITVNKIYTGMGNSLKMPVLKIIYIKQEIQ